MLRRPSGTNQALPVRPAPFTLLAILLGGCSSSPAQTVFGSFFPAWMLSALLGVTAAIVLRQVLSLLGIDRHLLAPPLTYLCLAVAGTLLVWLTWFGN